MTRKDPTPNEPITAELLDELCRFPLLDAIFDRRTRRFGLGMEIPDGPLAYRSKENPIPLSDLERMILVLCGCGVSGWNTGMEHTASGEPDTGCNYPLRLTGRTSASAAGCLASEMIFMDDSGAWLTRFRDLEPEKWREFSAARDLEKMAAQMRAHCVKLADGRVMVPQKPPHTSPHNVWNANRPGSTLFAPIVDLTQQALNFLAIYLSMGYVLYDAPNGRICGNFERFVKAGLVDDKRRFPLADFEQYVLATAAMEIALMCNNIVLALQAMGLGGWMYTGINPPSLMGAFSARGIGGLGFRFVNRPGWILPNPVGIDGYFEALCPPYFSDMRAAVDHFVDLKFGPGGAYDSYRRGPWRNSWKVRINVERYPGAMVEMLAEAADYIYRAYGKFPATIPSIYMRAYAQAQHIDLDFYDKFFGPDSYLASHAQHMRKWHGADSSRRDK
ncbi:MAG: hypothetical protein ACREP6_10450 [Candidatus Binataceae bacterium]